LEVTGTVVSTVPFAMKLTFPLGVLKAEFTIAVIEIFARASRYLDAVEIAASSFASVRINGGVNG
jgi:hypothetical protein